MKNTPFSSKITKQDSLLCSHPLRSGCGFPQRAKPKAYENKPFCVYYAACLILFFSVTGLFLFVGVTHTAPPAATILTSSVPLLYDENPPPAPVTSAKSAVLIDASSGAVLYAKNAHERMPMASTTKIMTALIVLETLPLDELVSVPKEAAIVEGSSIYLHENEKITVETLLYGLLLESGNDAAHTLAVACAGSIEAFAEKMNQKAADMGLRDTHFVNPHGLTADGHYTTAYELSLITAKALNNPTFRTMVSTIKKTAPSTDGSITRLFVNHNKLLKMYDGAIGVKTGFTKAAGRCLVGAAEREGDTFVTVTLNDGNDWNDHMTLWNFAFENFDTVEITAPGAFGIYYNGRRYTNTDGVYLTVPKHMHPTFSFKASISNNGGLVSYFAGGAELGRFALTAAD